MLALLGAGRQGGLSAEALVSEPDALSVRDAGSSERGEEGSDSQTDSQTDRFVCLTHSPQLAAAPAAPLGPPGGAESKMFTTEQELSGRTRSGRPLQQGRASPGDFSIPARPARPLGDARHRGAAAPTPARPGEHTRPLPRGCGTRRGSRSGRCRRCGSVAGSRAELGGEGRKGGWKCAAGSSERGYPRGQVTALQSCLCPHSPRRRGSTRVSSAGVECTESRVSQDLHVLTIKCKNKMSG